MHGENLKLVQEVTHYLPSGTI